MARAFASPAWIRALLREMLPLSQAAAARRLAKRAAAARDGRQFGVAAILYEEALRFNPGNARLRIQCGHMLKEAGDLPGAEEQYARAALDLPRDADLALQIGHLHKVAGRPEQAAASYRRALALSPGWREAERELALVGGSAEEAGSAQDGHADWVVPELLPRGEAHPAVDRNILRLFRLGGRRTHSRWGDLKVMRGIEAIRGYRLAAAGLTEIRLAIDGKTVRREPLRAYAQDEDGTQFKYVFNLWHDFSEVTPGQHRIELGFHDASGHRIRRHQETVLVAPPRDGSDFAQSDAFVEAAPDATSVEDAVNARPSMVRSVARRILPDPVRTILVQRVDQLGDLVCSVPAIRRLREIFPEAKLVGLLTPANLALAEQLGLFDEIVTVAFTENAAERRRVLAIEAQQELRRTLAPYRFDLAIDLGEGDESRALLLLSDARFLYGFKDRQAPWLDAGLDFNGHDPVNWIEIVPPSRKIMLLIEALRLMAEGQARAMPNPDRSGLADYGIAASDRYAVIHTGARLAYTRWPHFDALVAMLLARTDLKILLFSDDEATTQKIAAVGGGSDRLRIVTGQIPFAHFDALLAHCALFVGNDSGPKHLAALRGAPVVSLHMARLNWSEWGQEISGRIVSRRVPCAGCGIGLDGEDCGKDFACLRQIRPEEVFAAAQDLLKPPA
jgi:ADP-heptose:LPS heptosyltransferase